MITSILVALDDTAMAPHVLAAATEVAERFDARLYLFRAVLVPPEFPAAAADATSDDPLPEHLVKQAEDDLRRLAAGNARASAERPIVGFGDPWRAIVAIVDRLDVDLIVAGSHAYHWPDRILGTVAAKLANRGPRNLLIVRH